MIRAQVSIPGSTIRAKHQHLPHSPRLDSKYFLPNYNSLLLINQVEQHNATIAPWTAALDITNASTNWHVTKKIMLRPKHITAPSGFATGLEIMAFRGEIIWGSTWERYIGWSCEEGASFKFVGKGRRRKEFKDIDVRITKALEWGQGILRKSRIRIFFWGKLDGVWRNDEIQIRRVHLMGVSFGYLFNYVLLLVLVLLLIMALTTLFLGVLALGLLAKFISRHPYQVAKRWFSLNKGACLHYLLHITWSCVLEKHHSQQLNMIFSMFLCM